MLSALLAFLFSHQKRVEILPVPDIAPVVEIAHAEILPPETIDQKISRYASEYSLNEDHFRVTILCESNASSTIQSGYFDRNGKQEQSFGLAQIHLPDHPEISYAQAIDPDFSLDFMARQWVAGNAHLWTCWRQKYGAR